MKILHTSDLHLGLLRGGQSRRDDQERVLGEILALCETHDVDLLLIAGDVFSDRVGSQGHEEVARRLLERLRPRLEKGRAVLLLRGNHDPMPLFRLMRLLAHDMAGHDRWPLLIADVPDVYAVPGHNLQIVALPYVQPSWLREQAGASASNLELSALLERYLLEQVYPKITDGVPAVFAGHIMISGAEINKHINVEPDYAQDLKLAPSALPNFTLYNALGHIHLQQPIHSAPVPTWYSGAPERVDAGERDYTPGVLLITLPEQPGGFLSIDQLPIASCTPFVNKSVSGASAVQTLCQELKGTNPLGEITISGVDPTLRSAVLEQMKATAPRLKVHWENEVQAPVPVEPESWLHNIHDTRATVLAYLAKAFADKPQRRDQLAGAFISLLED